MTAKWPTYRVSDRRFDCSVYQLLTKATKTQDGDLLAWASTKPNEWAVHGKTSTHHRCRNRRRNAFRDLESEVFVRSNVRRVATLREGAITVLCAESVDGVRTVVLLVGLAVGAGQVCLNLRTDTDTVTFLDGLDILANPDSLANDLVANAERHRSITPAAIDGVQVRSADTAALNGDIDVAVLESLELELLGSSVSERLLTRDYFTARHTSCFLKSCHFFWSSIMKPVAVSG